MSSAPSPEQGWPVPVDVAGQQLYLHRHAVKPGHVGAWYPLWQRERALREGFGFTTHRAFLETDAEPKLSWVYSHRDGDAEAALAELVLSTAHLELQQEMAPHVFANLRIRPVEPLRLTRATPASVAGTDGRERIAIMRRYEIVGGWQAFLAVWEQVVQVRERYGFRCLFAVADRPHDLFTWAFDFDGEWPDFPAAQRSYYHDPRRVELRGVFDHMADYSIHPARQLDV